MKFSLDSKWFFVQIRKTKSCETFFGWFGLELNVFLALIHSSGSLKFFIIAVIISSECVKAEIDSENNH